MIKKMNVLFVCMGNICRSPMAEGVFLRDIRQMGLGEVVSVDSAGTHAYHVGQSPDQRGCDAAKSRDVVIDALRARRIEMNDFARFDYVPAMDRQNLDTLRYLCPPDLRGVLHLFSEFSPKLKNCEIPDPYIGTTKEFEKVLDMIELASLALVEMLNEQFH